MKMKKLLIALTTITTPALLTPFITSCGNETQCTINFSASDGIKLSSSTPISITKGKYWSDLIKDKNFPTVSFESEYTEIGWCKVNSQDQYEKIEKDFKIESNLNIKYVGYKTSEHPAISVELDYAPSATPVGLEFAGGLTFKNLKSFYNLPSSPTLEGYKFEGYYDSASNPLTDDYKFPNKNTNISIKWNADVHTVTLQNDGNGTVTSKTTYFPYGKTWKQIKEELEITPVPNEHYEFYKWVDKYGDDLSDDYVMKKDFTAKALFKPIIYQDVVFTCTDNTIFDGGYTKITKQVKSGTTWGELKNAGVIPTPLYPSKCTATGWYVISQTGSFEEITDDYIISNKTNVKFVAYNPDDYTLTVHFVYGPDVETEYKDLKYLKGATFGDFRAFYNIPESWSYEGYEFVGFYTGETKWEDSDVLSSDQSIINIFATFEQIEKTIYLTTNGNGTIESSSQITVKYGTKWKDIKGSIATKPNDGYVFDKWVFLDGTIIEDDYVIKEAVNVKAIFSTSKPIYQIWEQGSNSIKSAYFYSTDHGDSVDMKWEDTVRGWAAREGMTFNEPYVNNGCFHLETCGTNKDFRFLTVPIKISVPVTSRSTRKFKFHFDINHIVKLKAFFLSTDIQSTLEIFNLDNASDHPTFYANCKSNDDTRPSDPKSMYRYTVQESHPTWDDKDLPFRYQGDSITYSDTNDTDSTKYFDHYLEISLLVEGKKTSTNGQQGHVVDAQFSIVDIYD